MSASDASPPPKRARIDDDGSGSASHAVNDATASAAVAEESMRRMIEAAPSDTAARSTLHFPAAASASAAVDCAALGSQEQASLAADLACAPLAPFPPSADWSYDGARILAPMVRIGTLPMRQLAASYGATMCYSEELVALKLRHCVRRQRTDERGRTFVDFVPGAAGAAAGAHSSAAVSAPAQALEPTPLNSAFVGAASAAAPPRVHNANIKALPALTTLPGERLVVQLGAATAADALAAAQVVAGDCRAIDVNLGCPKHFSLQGGMGAALLSRPERAADILGTLRRNINLPLTCKIRLLHTDRESVELVRRLERMGVSAIALHARHIEDRPRHRALRERVRVVADALQVPLLYNGDCFRAEDIAGCMGEPTGARGVMIARGAMWNASIFRPLSSRPMLPLAEVVGAYVSLAAALGNHYTNTKYCVLEMLKGQVGASALFKAVTRAKDQPSLQAILAHPLTGMAAEPALTGPYRVPVVLEERPSLAEGAPSEEGASAAAARPVDVRLAASPSGGGSSSVAPPPGKKPSYKERKYAAKQKRKNREGRALDEQQQQQQRQGETAAAKERRDDREDAEAKEEEPAADARASSTVASAAAAAAASSAEMQ